jgi:hypothetical protein
LFWAGSSEENSTLNVKSSGMPVASLAAADQLPNVIWAVARPARAAMPTEVLPARSIAAVKWSMAPFRKTSCDWAAPPSNTAKHMFSPPSRYANPAHRWASASVSLPPPVSSMRRTPSSPIQRALVTSDHMAFDSSGVSTPCPWYTLMLRFPDPMISRAAADVSSQT